jgi:hypothetical protein
MEIVCACSRVGSGVSGATVAIVAVLGVFSGCSCTEESPVVNRWVLDYAEVVEIESARVDRRAVSLECGPVVLASVPREWDIGNIEKKKDTLGESVRCEVARQGNKGREVMDAVMDTATQVRWSKIDWEIEDRYRKVFRDGYTPTLDPDEFERMYPTDKALCEAYYRFDRDEVKSETGNLSRAQEAKAVVCEIGMGLFSLVKPSRLETKAGVIVYIGVRDDAAGAEMYAFAPSDSRGVYIRIWFPEDSEASRSEVMDVAVKFARGLSVSAEQE